MPRPVESTLIPRSGRANHPMSGLRALVFLITIGSLTVLSAVRANAQAGMLVMAHGGDDEWNGAVEELARELGQNYPVAMSFGMANPVTLQAGVDSLNAAGVSRITVMRLFVSAASFGCETAFYFGVDESQNGGTDWMGCPRWRDADPNSTSVPQRLTVNTPIVLSDRGLLDAPVVGSILRDRASALSQNPKSESVLIIGHGPASDVENEDWLRKMDGLADSVRASNPYSSVQVETLREDWTGKRAEAERRIREFVQSESSAGRTVLVVPFRLHGFGPYAEVLDGLTYRADGMGFLPDDRIARWVEEEFIRLGGLVP